jgi:hypothetical protein
LQVPTPPPPPPPIQTPAPTPTPQTTPPTTPIAPIQTPAPTPTPQTTPPTTPIAPIQTPTPPPSPPPLIQTPAPPPTPTPTPTPINENAEQAFLDVVAITANRQQAPENVAVNVLDANQSTRWSGQGNDTWIQADLGSEKPIKNLGIAWYKGASRQYNFTIAISNTTEAKDFVKVFTGQSSGTTDSTERYDTKGIQGRFLRISIDGNTDSEPSARDWASITTLEPYSLESSFKTPVQPVARLDTSSLNL